MSSLWLIPLLQGPRALTLADWPGRALQRVSGRFASATRLPAFGVDSVRWVWIPAPGNSAGAYW